METTMYSKLQFAVAFTQPGTWGCNNINLKVTQIDWHEESGFDYPASGIQPNFIALKDKGRRTGFERYQWKMRICDKKTREWLSLRSLGVLGFQTLPLSHSPCQKMRFEPLKFLNIVSVFDTQAYFILSYWSWMQVYNFWGKVKGYAEQVWKLFTKCFKLFVLKFFYFTAQSV